MIKTAAKDNIILIGMAGAGKSTIGVLLAKTLGMSFMDSDLYIQSKEDDFLQNIIDRSGILAFLSIEEMHILSLNVSNHIIATGGSAVYSDKAMKHLKKNGRIVFLDAPYEVIEKRVRNIRTRGLVKKKGQTLYDVFIERRPLYLKHADIVVNCCNKRHEAVLNEILKKLR